MSLLQGEVLMKAHSSFQVPIFLSTGRLPHLPRKKKKTSTTPRPLEGSSLRHSSLPEMQTLPSSKTQDISPD